MKNSICEYVNAHHTDILSTFNELHSMPEPALREVRTADYLKTQLKQAGFDVRGILRRRQCWVSAIPE